jgi:hypothetical protein
VQEPKQQIDLFAKSYIADVSPLQWVGTAGSSPSEDRERREVDFCEGTLG